MKYLSILMVGVALLDGGYGEREVADEKPAKEEAPTKVPMREGDEGELERRNGVKYVNDETEPFTGGEILYRKDGSKAGKRPHLNGIKHGTMIWYSRNGWKQSESPFVNGKLQWHLDLVPSGRVEEVGSRLGKRQKDLREKILNRRKIDQHDKAI